MSSSLAPVASVGNTVSPTEADCASALDAAHHDRMRQSREHGGNRLIELRGAVLHGDENGELVATETGNAGVGFERGFEPGRDLLQQLIARRVAEDVTYPVASRRLRGAAALEPSAARLARSRT